MKLLSIRFQKVVKGFKQSISYEKSVKKPVVSSYRIISLRNIRQFKKSGNSS